MSFQTMHQGDLRKTRHVKKTIQIYSDILQVVKW